MYRPKMRLLAQATAIGSTCGCLIAQTAPAPAPPPSKVEPGLEQAVHWKWSVTPSDGKPWGMPLPEELKPKPPAAPTSDGTPAPAPAPAAEERPSTYEVKKGDALIKIAKKFSMTPAQLKQFNELKDDRIIIGQVLKIPTPGELLAMQPPPPPPAPPESEADKDKGKGKGKAKDGDKAEADLVQEPATPEQLELETVLLQVFLDRELFASSAIDGKGGAMFQKVSQLYQDSHSDAASWQNLKAKALAAVKQPYTNYVLRTEDFHFIKPRKAALAAIPVAENSAPAPKKKGSKANPKLPPGPPPPLSYDEMVAADFLGYSSAWEFVAERFHCDEAFLRRLNAKLGDPPAVGAIFQVPNVIPFEIEKALEQPLQPAADPQKPVTAAVVDLSLLKITREGQLVAVLPVASARPGLNGRGTWTILDAIPQPHLSTKREPREAPKAPPAPADGTAPAPAAEQVLPAGPNNPLGIVWINLAKAKSNTPLPYGLHGTSIPGQMKSLEGIGGFRLTNWDIARAVRLMPAGTTLQWELSNPKAAR
ncbi:LysM peptidoglycan-binding domain-containing protein [Haloferula sp. BvORR071]|uniref:L,D-transpeptidase family protein n=1 Tax=Haloferula sp. BvORR071 TaxID=1396141 RepID=UPI000A429A16|nr:LysM peptidoglycan-binding domain-containing protein [Haloferula sp. BvORR071]